MNIGNGMAAYIADDPKTGAQQLWVQVPSLPDTQEWLILATTRLTQEQLVAAAKGVTVTIPATPPPCESPCG